MLPTASAEFSEGGIATHLHSEFSSEPGLPLIVACMYKVPITMKLG